MNLIEAVKKFDRFRLKEWHKDHYAQVRFSFFEQRSSIDREFYDLDISYDMLMSEDWEEYVG